MYPDLLFVWVVFANNLERVCHVRRATTEEGKATKPWPHCEPYALKTDRQIDLITTAYSQAAGKLRDVSALLPHKILMHLICK